MKKIIKNRILLCILILGAINVKTLQSSQEPNPATCNNPIIVFIHGTVFPPLALLDPLGVKRGTIHENSLYRAASSKLCSNKYYTGSQTFSIEQSFNKLFPKAIPQDQAHACAYYFASAMNLISEHAQTLKGAHYYSFGWSGLLSHKERIYAARELYKHLSLFPKETPITLIAHSYGGSVVLNMALEEEKHKKNLTIQNVFLYSTPINDDNMKHLSNPMFKNIFNIFSDGDIIQVMDIVSTKSSCHRKMSSVMGTATLEKVTKEHGVRRLDIRLLGNGNSSMFGHSDCSLMAYKKQYKALFPFPFSILTPLILKLLAQQAAPPLMLDLHLNEIGKEFFITIHEHKAPTALVSSDELFKTICSVRDEALKNWNKEYNVFHFSNARKALTKLVKWQA